MIRRQQHLIPEPNPEGNPEAQVPNQLNNEDEPDEPEALVPTQINEDEFAPEEAGDEDEDALSLPEGVPSCLGHKASLL